MNSAINRLLRKFIESHTTRGGSVPFPLRKFEALRQKLQGQNYPVKNIDELRDMLQYQSPEEFEMPLTTYKGKKDTPHINPLEMPLTTYRGEYFSPLKHNGQIKWDSGEKLSEAGTRSLHHRVNDLGRGVMLGDKANRADYDLMYTSMNPAEAIEYAGNGLGTLPSGTPDLITGWPHVGLFHRIQLPEGTDNVTQSVAHSSQIFLPYDMDFKIEDVHRIDLGKFGDGGLRDLFMLDLEAKSRRKK